MVRIIDTSHWNIITDWKKIKDPVILKCTEGLTFIDSTFKERKEKAGKLFYGSYHFFRDVDPIKQADFYLKTLGEVKGIMVLDFEIECSNPVEKCKKFINRVKEKTSQDCWLYTNDARALKYAWPKEWKFWIARYADYTGSYYPDFHPKFTNWSIHQYTSRGKIDGIQGNVDLNVVKNEEAIPPIPEPQMGTGWACGTCSDKIATLKEKIINQSEMINELNKKIETLKQERDKYKEQTEKGIKALTIIDKIKLIFGG